MRALRYTVMSDSHPPLQDFAPSLTGDINTYIKLY